MNRPIANHQSSMDPPAPQFSTRKHSTEQQGSGNAKPDSSKGQDQSLAEHHPEHCGRRGAEREADAQVARPLPHDVRNHAIGAHGGQRQRNAGEEDQCRHRKATACKGALDAIRHRRNAMYRQVWVDAMHGAGDRGTTSLR
jgi:hypothetical protein